MLADPAALADLNALVHPAVAARRRDLLAGARRRGDRIVVSDIPLLFEAADPAAFDAVVLVDAPAAVRRARPARERGLPADEAERLMAAQQPAAEQAGAQHFVIDNDGDRASLERAARQVWTALLARA